MDKTERRGTKNLRLPLVSIYCVFHFQITMINKNMPKSVYKAIKVIIKQLVQSIYTLYDKKCDKKRKNTLL